jgi:hypothetical protein
METVDFYKWTRGLTGVEKAAWDKAATSQKLKIKNESAKTNKLPVFGTYGWTVGDSHYGKDASGGRRRRTRKSKRRQRKTRRRHK